MGALFVLLSLLVIELTGRGGAWVAKAFENIRLLIQYNGDEREQLNINHKSPYPLMPIMFNWLVHTHVHIRYIYAITWWYMHARAKAFKEWWKDPETYSLMERNGHGASNE